jgi:hypothetical protein
MKRAANVVKFPKPNKRGGWLPIGAASLTIEQLIEVRDSCKTVVANCEAAIEARLHPAVVYLRREEKTAHNPPRCRCCWIRQPAASGLPTRTR